MRMLLKNFWIFAVAVAFTVGWCADDEPSISPLAKDEAGDPWEKALQVKTKHFLLRTDTASDEAKKLASDVERLHAAFFDFFSGVISPDKISRPLEISFYNDYKRYQQTMRKTHPEREKGDGFFNTKDGIAHFFRVETKSPNAVVTTRETIFHECTHQLMHFTVGSLVSAAKKPHFWVVEGLAGYFEGLGTRDEARSPADSHPNRFRILAKYRDDVKKIRLATFVLHDQKALSTQGVPDVNYAVCAGLAHFLAITDNGRLRDAFRKYALTVHEGKATGSTFQEIFRAEADALQPEWEKFLDGLKE